MKFEAFLLIEILMVLFINPYLVSGLLGECRMARETEQGSWRIEIMASGTGNQLMDLTNDNQELKAIESKKTFI